MAVRQTLRALVLGIMLASMVASSGGVSVLAAATPDVPFVDDLEQLQPVILTNLSHIHTWLAKQPCRYYQFDETYDNLAAEVNGFLVSLAGDISRNNFHEQSWKDESSAIIDQLKKFNDLLTQTQTAIEDNSLPPPAMNCPYSTLQSSGGPPPPPGKPQFQVSIPVSDVSKMITDAQTRRIEGLQADNAERAAFASTILQQKWPQECELNLQGKKLPCVEGPAPSPSPPAHT